MMHPCLKLLTKSGKEVTVFVTQKDGLINIGDESVFVIKFLTLQQADALVDSWELSNSPKIARNEEELLNGKSLEIPLIHGNDENYMECRNDAYTLKAMINLGIDSIPIMVATQFVDLY